MDFPISELARESWPELIHEMADPPKRLFLRGALPAQGTKILAVVGSRAATTYGRDAVRTLLAGLKGHPISIVSGLALGIDAIAHETALAHGLHTVSVPGSGIDDSVIYPTRHRSLAKRILEEGGALLSEFEPTFRATPWSFPARNRIMAGMAHAVLVVEATQKSGTLITSRLATEYNRDVLAVPGSIFSPGSAGPAMLIRLGATPVTTSAELLEALGFETHARARVEPTLDGDEKRIYDALTEPRTRDDIMRMLDLHPAHASVIISLLELKGHIIDSGNMLHRA